MTEQNPSISTHSPYERKTAPVEKATFRRRLVASIVDAIILGFVDGNISRLGGNISRLSGNNETSGWWTVILGLLGTAVYAIYYILSYSTGGQTLGKMILGIKVVSIDGSPLSWRKGILRTVGYTVSAFPLGLGYMWSMWDKDRQTWHDKIAGTCVVPATVKREDLQGTVDPMEARRSQRRWLLALGIPALATLLVGGALLGFLLLRIYQSGEADMNALGTWPGPEVSSQELISVDLSNLGLRTGQIRDARDAPEWASRTWHYVEGRVISYQSGQRTVVTIWALKYEDLKTAGNDFSGVTNWAANSCGFYTSAGGVLHCAYSDAYDKVFWNNRWMVDIIAWRGTEFTPEALVDKVRDALATHWKKIAQP